MLLIGLVITFLTGLSLLNLISRNFSVLEKAGLSFLTGLALQTLLMLVMDALGLGLKCTLVFRIEYTCLPEAPAMAGDVQANCRKVAFIEFHLVAVHGSGHFPGVYEFCKMHVLSYF